MYSTIDCYALMVQFTQSTPPFHVWFQLEFSWNANRSWIRRTGVSFLFCVIFFLLLIGIPHPILWHLDQFILETNHTAPKATQLQSIFGCSAYAFVCHWSNLLFFGIWLNIQKQKCIFDEENKSKIVRKKHRLRQGEWFVEAIHMQNNWKTSPSNWQ